MARNLIRQWSKFENLFMSIVLLDLFLVTCTSPISKYLQRKNINYSTAWKLVEKLLIQVKDKRSDKHFQALYAKTKYYTSTIHKLEDSSIDVELDVEFKEKRTWKKKLIPGEKSVDETPGISTAQNYKLIFISILDCARTNIEDRFSPNKDIFEDCSWLDPKKFMEIVMLDKFPTEVLSSISKLCKVERSQFLIELKQFADQYESCFTMAEKSNTERKQDNLNGLKKSVNTTI